MALFGKSLAGPGYIILNLLRSMNIIGLLFLATASIILLIKMAIVTNVSLIWIFPLSVKVVGL